MSNDANDFNLASNDAAEESLAPTPASPAPKPSAPQPGQGVRHPGERRERPTRKVVRKDAAPKSPEPRTEGGPALPFPFRPAFLLVLGTVVLAVLWAGGLFGGSAGPGAWPWEMFRTEGGAITFTWDAAHVYTVLGAFFGIFFLFAPLAPATRSRGASVLTVAALGMVTFPILTHLDRTVGLLGLTAGAIFARQVLHGGSGGRGFLFVMVLLLGAALFFPFPTAPTDAGYLSQAQSTIHSLFGGDEAFGDVILEPGTAVVLMALVLIAVGLLGWLGISGRWSVWVAGIALLLGVLGPIALAWHATDAATCREGLQAVAGRIPAHLLVFALPVAAGAFDASRS